MPPSTHGARRAANGARFLIQYLWNQRLPILDASARALPTAASAPEYSWSNNTAPARSNASAEMNAPPRAPQDLAVRQASIPHSSSQRPIRWLTAASVDKVVGPSRGSRRRLRRHSTMTINSPSTSPPKNFASRQFVRTISDDEPRSVTAVE